MGRENIKFVNIAVIGNTHLTYKLLIELEQIERPKYIFGLPNKLLAKKVNAVDLSPYCHSRNIILDTSNDWYTFAKNCEQLGIETILEFGDSRIIPNFITSRYQIIGNHGAILPDVQGAASLVWGRMLNDGRWGVSLFEVNEKIDAGDILAVEAFEYDPSGTMEEFVTLADDVTIDLFLKIVAEGFERRRNCKWQIRVAKRSDTYKAIQTLALALEIDAPIYMPPRGLEDGKLNVRWPLEFQETFRRVNNVPYPMWHFGD